MTSTINVDDAGARLLAATFAAMDVTHEVIEIEDANAIVIVSGSPYEDEPGRRDIEDRLLREHLARAGLKEIVFCAFPETMPAGCDQAPGYVHVFVLERPAPLNDPKFLGHRHVISDAYAKIRKVAAKGYNAALEVGA